MSAVDAKSLPTRASGFSLPPDVTDTTISKAMMTPIKLSPTIKPDAKSTPRWLHASTSSVS